MDEKEASLEVAGTECEVVLLVPFGVFLRSIVVAFAVHYFVTAPVHYRASCYTYFENVAMGEHQVSSHKASKAPSVDTHTLGIYPRLLL